MFSIVPEKMGFSSIGMIPNVKHVKWLVEGFEQIVHHLFPVPDTTEYSRRFQGGTADRALSLAQKQGKCTADTSMRMLNVVFCPSARGRPIHRLWFLQAIVC